MDGPHNCVNSADKKNASKGIINSQGHITISQGY